MRFTVHILKQDINNFINEIIDSFRTNARERIKLYADEVHDKKKYSDPLSHDTARNIIKNVELVLISSSFNPADIKAFRRGVIKHLTDAEENNER